MSSTTTATGALDPDGSTAGTETIAPSSAFDAIAVAASLPLDEKVALLTGAATWTLRAIPELGLRTMTVSDGPIGVRGTGDDGLPSAQLPAPSATAATWDVDLQARLGTLMAAEARRKAVDVILAPVVNLQRSPVGGRHFECLSEDPFLTARLAVAFVDAIQAQGIAACVKHFVGNETETDRTEYLSRIDERTLREVYLAPFEAVVDAGVWTIMAAYNGLTRDGVDAPATAHRPLLTEILKGEWGFDGIVVSDWLATKTAVGPALGGLDLVMPGPGGPWADGLLAAVRARARARVRHRRQGRPHRAPRRARGCAQRTPRRDPAVRRERRHRGPGGRRGRRAPHRGGGPLDGRAPQRRRHCCPSRPAPTARVASPSSATTRSSPSPRAAAARSSRRRT